MFSKIGNYLRNITQSIRFLPSVGSPFTKRGGSDSETGLTLRHFPLQESSLQPQESSSEEPSFPPALSNQRLAGARGYLSRKLELERGPNFLGIEITNACNLSCIMCPRQQMKRKVGFMDFRLFQKIIAEAQESVEMIYLHFMGEPLLHPELKRFINYTAARRITVALSTNAMLLTGEAADTLLESRLDFLMIPFDGATPETVEHIRKGSNFQILKKNVEDFLRKIKNKNPSFNVILQLIQMPQNRGDIDRFVQTWKDFPEAKVIVKDLHDFANQVENIQTLKHGKEKIPERTEGACYEPWRGMIVGWDGQVVPCCNDFDYKYVLGDLNRETLLQVWNGSRMKSLRRLQSKGKAKEILLCQRCFFPSLSPVQAYSLFSPFSSSLFELNCYANQGLYPADFGFDPPLHWTEKNFEILVQDRCGRVIFHFENRNPWASSLEMEIYCYDRWVTTAVFKKGERKAIQLSTPPDFQGRLLRFRFRLSHTWIPDSQTEGRDKGEVGILLQGIENG